MSDAFVIIGISSVLALAIVTAVAVVSAIRNKKNTE
jgi:hypothetical protein